MTQAQFLDCGTRGSADWCADRAGHPQFQDDGYPSLNHHRTECRAYDGWFGALTDDGTPGFQSMYLVRPFRFGQERGSTVDETRLAIEFDPAEDGGHLFRCTVPATIIRNPVRAPDADGGRSGRMEATARHVRLTLTDQHPVSTRTAGRGSTPPACRSTVSGMFTTATARRSPALAFGTGAAVGLLGGLIGLGGAEFRLPLLIGVFGFAALQAVIVNKAMSLVVVLTALPARLIGCRSGRSPRTGR